MRFVSSEVANAKYAGGKQQILDRYNKNHIDKSDLLAFATVIADENDLPVETLLYYSASITEKKHPSIPVPFESTWFKVNHLKKSPSACVTILTDTTNAEFIAELYGDRLRYDHLRTRWLIWNSHYWQEDSDGEMYRLATNAARERYKRSVNITDLKERQRVANWAISSEQRGRLEAL